MSKYRDPELAAESLAAIQVAGALLALERKGDGDALVALLGECPVSMRQLVMALLTVANAMTTWDDPDEYLRAIVYFAAGESAELAGPCPADS